MSWREIEWKRKTQEKSEKEIPSEVQLEEKGKEPKGKGKGPKGGCNMYSRNNGAHGTLASFPGSGPVGGQEAREGQAMATWAWSM